ncbi:hypothetical protein WCT78_00180 [Pectobacterium versatile]|nr:MULTISPECIES: hypothetical protein [Pectobacterium]MBD0847092.1 hypothetical protein [Pectobacterium carotovorum subsp. carotovorum]MBI0472737.1 hypothetical protein [Pectobacterium parmentieri]MBI0495382.1 hypothetical protein [Pectobacterium parmentieri]MBI0569912.1 hypothetical protein [Pectobacterium parmentieri]MBI0574629.1 hypothetical protein [Pectobacterium parmentieri]
MDRVVAPNMCRYISVKYERMLTNFAKKINISKEALKRIISSLIAMLASHLITLPIISYILLINFMRENKILSYELINELYLSNKLFILISIIFLVAFSMSLLSFIIPLYLYFIDRKENNKKYNIGIKTIIATLTFNMVIFILLSISLTLKGGVDWEYTLLILMTSLYIVIHAIVHLTAKTLSKIFLHAMLIIFVSGICIMPNSFASRLFSIGLQEFSVGGNIPATIYHQSAKFGENVRIILHTPKTLFFRKGDIVGLIPGDKINMIIYRKNTDDKEKARN